MIVMGATLKLGKWLSSFQYIVAASDVIQNAYSQVNPIINYML